MCAADPSLPNNTRPDEPAPRSRILDVAEQLFMQDGFAAVSLRQVAEAAGLRQATLYHHFPDGKEALYLAVLARAFDRRRKGLEQAIAAAPPDLNAHVHAVFAWLGSQPPIHFMAMMHKDMPALTPPNAQAIAAVVYDAMFGPLIALFTQAIANGEARPMPPEFFAGALIALADGITFSMTQSHAVPRKVMEQAMAQLLLEGCKTSPASNQEEKMYRVS